MGKHDAFSVSAWIFIQILNGGQSGRPFVCQFNNSLDLVWLHSDIKILILQYVLITIIFVVVMMVSFSIMGCPIGFRFAFLLLLVFASLQTQALYLSKNPSIIQNNYNAYQDFYKIIIITVVEPFSTLTTFNLLSQQAMIYEKIIMVRRGWMASSWCYYLNLFQQSMI